MKPAARNLILCASAVVWLAMFVAPASTPFPAARAGTTPATTTTTPPPALAPATAPAAARTSVRDLLAHGTDQRFWSADVIPVTQGKTSGTKTFLRVRGPGDSQWRLIGELEAPAVALANRGNELLVVLEGGDWRIVSESGARSGNLLPSGADVLALAGDGDDIWAVGAGPVAADTADANATTTATAPATAATGTITATTAPSPAATTAGGATTTTPTPGTATATATATATTTPKTGPATAATGIATATTGTAANAGETSGAIATVTAATTKPTPAASGERVSLYQLSGGDWVRRESLPPDLDRADLRIVSLAVLDRKLTLALIDSDGVVRIYTRREGGGWDKGHELTVAAAGAAAGATRLRLLDLRGHPALWLSDPTGPGSLYIAGRATGAVSSATATTSATGATSAGSAGSAGGAGSAGSAGGAGGAKGRWQGPVRLAPFPKLGNYDRTALATALGQLRLLASDGKQKLAEQIYHEDGSLSGPATEAVTAPSPLDNRVAQLIQMFVVAVLFIWMMGALRQRPETQEAAKRVDQLNLAPMGRRMLGGAIDLLPIAIGLYVAQTFAPLPEGGVAGAGASAGLTYASPHFAWIAAGVAIYLLHTTAFELLFARSPGKFATGTRVAALDGTRPTVLALLTRNLLRIVDVILVFPPVFVFFSPLRQRVGDMAAGTLVVMTTPMEPVTGADETTARNDDTPSTPPPPPPQG